VGSSRINNSGSCTIHGQREALPHAERQRARFGVGIVDKADIDHELGDTFVSAVRGQMKKPRMQTQVLPHGQFAIERERLRHETHALADRQVVGIDRLSADSASPSLGASNPVSIFMVVVLPLPFEPRKPKISRARWRS
jgi:hypothetical protein